VRKTPYTVHGCRPTSVVIQPAMTAIKPSGAVNWHRRWNQTASHS
jgi:hypothetical protein